MTGSAMSGGTVLELKAFNVDLGRPGKRVRVVDDLSLTLHRGQITCLVGESGSGKSVTAMALMRLLPDDRCHITAETLRFEGHDIATHDERAMTRLRGARMAMIFQEPMTSLNPVFTIGEQIAETLRTHKGLGKAAARARALEVLRQVQLPAAERRLESYPHELSGGQRQRVMIAMALACTPALLIADEPTTALDVTIQAQILSLLAVLRRQHDTAILFITHNLGVVAEIADDVAVMYAGRIVEQAPVATLFRDAQHPYTLALLAAMPSLADRQERLQPIPGRMPAPGTLPPGCTFAPRCPFAAADCEAVPKMRELAAGHQVACWRAPVEGLV